MIEEYTEVIGDQPQLLRKILGEVELCYPLTELDIIRQVVVPWIVAGSVFEIAETDRRCNKDRR
jgi:hypothetical protein